MRKLIIPMMALSIACSDGSKKVEQETEEKVTEEHVEEVTTDQENDEPKLEDGVFGTDFTEENVVKASEIEEKVTDTSGVELIAQGTITSCCQKKGCWMKMEISDGEDMMVRFKDYGFFVPKDLAGNEVYIKGVAKRKMIPVDELKHYAEDAGKSQEEIDAITEPSEELTFLAEGVKIVSKQ